MEEQYYARRAALRALLHQHPEWTLGELAEATGGSMSWVKKWRKRLREAAPDDEAVLHGQSRAPRHQAEAIGELVVAAILAIRDAPPGNLKRVPGPQAILHYLNEQAWPYLVKVPHSTSTVWRILRAHGRIAVAPPVVHEPAVRAAPLQHWQLDFKDVSSVRPDPDGDGKRQHVVETLNGVDIGTSRVMLAEPHADYNAETVLETMAEALRGQGLPQAVTFDRDPRFVGSWSGKDFPSTWVRFWQCLGVQVTICPPHRPDKNAFVERYHRSYQAECLAVAQPRDLDQARQVTQAFVHHYNTERPNQARVCNNRPPDVAFPQRPVLPAVPATVDLDAWLPACHGRAFARRLDANGCFKLGDQRYYAKRAAAHQLVSVTVDAHQQCLLVRLQGVLLRSLPLKGLQHRVLPYDDFVAHMAHHARQEWRRSRAVRP